MGQVELGQSIPGEGKSEQRCIPEEGKPRCEENNGEPELWSVRLHRGAAGSRPRRQEALMEEGERIGFHPHRHSRKKFSSTHTQPPIAIPHSLEKENLSCPNCLLSDGFKPWFFKVWSIA